jgi:predicted unusual protein kinase regulating ubiquinone biosynthesis (AarF/ABC1/UbiB family)
MDWFYKKNLSIYFLKMKKLKKIKDSFVLRQLATAKLSIKTARDFYKYRKEGSLKETLKGTFQGNIDEIVSELDIMKGSLMKAGQMLSLFGGSFLPEELKQILKKLENQSSYLEWEEIKKQVPRAWLEELDIEHEPLASASLGQVHFVEVGGRVFCMKIQYRGVKNAINNDIRALKFLVNFFRFVPAEIDLKPMFLEIKNMLILETNYSEEARSTIQFKKLLQGEKAFYVPEVLEEYSNEKIITTEFIKGESLHNVEELNLTQEQRNSLGREFMKLFFLEIFVYGQVQTDAHFGNYLIIMEPEPKWGLIDFGATKVPPTKFLENYQKLIIALKDNDKDAFVSIIYEMGYLSKKKDSDLELFWEYAQVIGTAFINKEFDWGKTDLADKVFEYIPKLIKSISIGNPPSDTIFLDKKLGGVFFVLQKLKSKFNPNELLEEVLLLKKLKGEKVL